MILPLVRQSLLFISFTMVFINIAASVFPLVNLEALELYSEGNFRHSVEVLTNKSGLSSLEYYLLGRDYQELNDMPGAISNFEKVKTDDLKKEDSGSFYLENYCYFCSKALLSSSAADTNTFITNLEAVSNLFCILPENSVYSNQILDTYLFFLWKSRHYKGITNLEGSNFILNFYKNFSELALGNKKSLSLILQYRKNQTFFSLYKDIMQPIEVDDFNGLNRQELSEAFSAYLGMNPDKNNFRFMDYLLQLQYSLSKDEDFYISSKMTIEFLKGNKNSAVKGLMKFYEQKKASLKTVRLLVTYLNLTGKYNSALSILKNEILNEYSLYDDYINVLTKLGKFENLYAWYLSKSGNPAFLRNHEDEIFRILLRNNLNLAKKMAEYSIRNNKNYHFVYLSGLIDLNGGDESTAYRKFLDVELNDPYSFEWIVSKQYEEALRTNYFQIYREELNKKIENLSTQSNKTDLSAFLAVNESEDGNFHGTDPWINEIELFRQKINGSLTAVSNEQLDPYEKYVKSGDSQICGFIPELSGMMEANINDNALKARAVYYYRDWFKSIHLNSLILSRLNSYTEMLMGYNNYYLMLDKNLQKDLFPVDLFESVNSVIGDTNQSYWVLSAFRQESYFNYSAVSRTGAIGISQLMPATAETLKQRLGKEELSIYDSMDNINLGAEFFRILFKKYGGNIAYSLAAYNAGETTVNAWRKKYPYRNELWFECLDYNETREYIKNIYIARFFYSRIYNSH